MAGLDSLLWALLYYIFKQHLSVKPSVHLHSTAKKTEQLPDLPERLQTIFPPHPPPPDQVVFNSLKIKKNSNNNKQRWLLVWGRGKHWRHESWLKTNYSLEVRVIADNVNGCVSTRTNPQSSQVLECCNKRNLGDLLVNWLTNPVPENMRSPEFLWWFCELKVSFTKKKKKKRKKEKLRN